VHVSQVQDATKLWEACRIIESPTSISGDNLTFTSNAHIEKRALEVLANKFWPGPLTLVAKASPEIPSIIMANTGFVACRSPSHPIARRLIAASGVPIAAPSANKFGHVSPTRAAHVMDDLRMEDVWIINPDLDQDLEQTNNELVCDVGVESTVAKVEMLSEGMGRVTILRHGAVSAMEILECLVDRGLGDSFEVVEKMQATGESVSHVAPGQTIRHYSPNVESFLISHERYANKSNIWSDEEKQYLETAVIIDFAGRLNSLKEMALAYRDLSSDGNSNMAAANVFDALRWSETVDGVQRVYFPEILVDESNVGKNEALVLAIKDKLTRAASGVVIDTLR
jgi:Putative translation factor (SUA5)